MQNKSAIYSITNIINGKICIGQTLDYPNRWRQHKYLLRHNRHHNPHLQASWNKYGELNFSFNIISLCPVESLDSEEVRYINQYKSNNREFGYNLNDGGNRPKHSEETKKKMSETRKRNPIRAMLGKHHSEEVKNRIGNINRINSTGKHHSEETKKKMKESSKLFWDSEKSLAVREKISKSNRKIKLYN